MHGVETEEMRVRLDRAEIVDRDHFDVFAARLDDGAQYVAADAAETVDGDTNCHALSLRGAPRSFPNAAVAAATIASVVIPK